MKFKRSTLFSILLLPLMLTSCGGNTPTTTPSNPGSGSTTEKPTPDSTKPTDKDSTTSSPTGTTEDSGDVDPSETQWNEEIIQLMQEHLGGNVIPDVYIGKSNQIEGKYVEDDKEDDYLSSVVLTGDTFVASNLKDAIETYKKYGYEVVFAHNVFTAVNEKNHLTVIVSPTDDNLFELRAYYDEPFDSSSVTEWNDDVKEAMLEHFGQFSTVVPFTYLGTQNYKWTFLDTGVKIGESSTVQTTADENFVVTGGVWNDDVVSIFESTFASWTDATKEDDPVTTKRASYTTANASTFTATLEEKNNKAQLSVEFNEKFDAENQTAWPEAVKTKFKASFGDLEIPYVYLGATYPRVDATNTNSARVTVLGKHWDDAILTSAKASFEADGWTSEAVEEGSNSAKFSKSVNGQTITVSITKMQDANGTPRLSVMKSEEYNADTFTAWPEAVKTKFEDMFEDTLDDTLPKVYIGTANPTINGDMTTSNEMDGSNVTSYGQLIIDGGHFDQRLLSEFDTKFNEESGWVVANEDYDSYGSGYNDDKSAVYRVALKKVGNEVYKVSLFSLYEDTSVSLDKTAFLEITKSVDVNVSTKWSDEAKKTFENVLGTDFEMPFFDVGSNSGEASITGYNGELKINFSYTRGTLSTGIWKVYQALKADGWTFAKLGHNMYRTQYNANCDFDYISASKKVDDDKTVVIKVESNSNGYLYGTVATQEKYNKSKAASDWTSDITSEISNKYGLKLPYVYLGTTSPYITYDEGRDGNKIMCIWGNAKNDQILADARTAFTAAGYTIDESSSSSEELVAKYTKTNNDALTADLDLSDDRPVLKLSFVEGFDPTAGTEWTAPIKTAFSSYLTGENAVPYIYLGTIAPTVSASNNQYKVTDSTTGAETLMNSDTKSVSVIGGNWKDEVLDLAKQKLDADTTDGGWHAESTQIESGWNTSSAVTAYKDLGNNKYLRLKIYKNGNDKIEMDVFFDTENTQSYNENPTNWASIKYGGYTATEYLEDRFGTTGAADIPSFLYFTKNDSSVSSTSVSESGLSNRRVSFNNYSSELTSYSIYKSMEMLTSKGFTATLNPFAQGSLPGFTATKTTDNGDFVIDFKPGDGDMSLNDDGYLKYGINHGFKVYIYNYEKFDDSKTDWDSDIKNAMSSNLNGYVLPYFDLGATWNDTLKSKFSSNKLTITAYNYSEAEFGKAYTALKNGGWDISYSYLVKDGTIYKGLNGKYEHEGKTFVLDMTPNISGFVKNVTLTIQII